MYKKKILFVDHDNACSGSTISLKEIIKSLEYKYDVIVLTCKNDLSPFIGLNIRTENLQDNLILSLHIANDYSFFNPKYYYVWLLLIIRFYKGFKIGLKKIKEINPDIVYINEYVFLQFAYAAYRLNKRVVIHIRSLMFKGFLGFRKRILTKLMLKISKKIITISEPEYEQFNLPKDKVILIREFFSEQLNNSSQNSIDIKNKYNLPLEKKYVLMMGGISKIKGTIIFLKACSLLNKKNISFILCGQMLNNTYNEKKYLNKCMKLINKLSENSQLYYFEYIENINELIQISDIVVSSNLLSHFSRPAVESWLLNKTVVFSDIQHSQFMVTKFKEYILYEYNNYMDLFHKIDYLIKNEMLLKEISMNYKNEALKKYGFDNIKKLNDTIDNLDNRQK